MDICDFVAYRIFSENGLWQWYEKPGLSESRDRAKEILMTTDAFFVTPLMRQLQEQPCRPLMNTYER